MPQQKGGIYPKYRIKVLTLGDSGTGKTSLIGKWSKEDFDHQTISTIGFDYNQQLIDVDGDRVTAQVWDTAGQEKFMSVTNSLFRGCQAVLFVYDSTNEFSFTNIKRWLKSLRENCKEKVDSIECVLCANKIDLIKDSKKRSEVEERGQSFARNVGMDFFVTSALTGENVEIAFFTPIAAVKRRLDHEGGIRNYKPSVVIGDGDSGGKPRKRNPCC